MTAPTIHRIDRYTLSIDGHRVTAGPEQEAEIRSLSPDQLRALLRIMGQGEES